ncbi:alkaline phosphatase [bacterium]|nr:alkaline phosphatase [bacterium]
MRSFRDFFYRTAGIRAGMPAVLFFMILAVSIGSVRASGPSARNLIFCIGDGMGISQIAAARISMAGPDGRSSLERMPVTGLGCTHSADQLVTDSGAGGTALSTGFKTKNGMIGMNPDTVAVRSILEACMARGMSAGLVATSSVTHATPAAFGAHVPDRDMQFRIAEQLLENRIQVLLGGGLDYFLPESSGSGKRRDGRDLLSAAGEAGYAVVRTREAFEACKSEKIIGLFGGDHLTDGAANEPTLAELSRKAIDALQKDPDGFFLMIEGSQIDWACHGNDFENMIRQFRSFDEAVGRALAFAEKDGRTLVVVTADHETGGLALLGGMMTGDSLKTGWATDHHSGIPVPVFASGPGAESFTGVHDNTDIPKIAAKILGLKDFPGFSGK